MQAESILAEWMRLHGPLDRDLQNRFLVKDGIVDQLTRFPDEIVRAALRKQRLADVLERAKSLSDRTTSASSRSSERTASDAMSRHGEYTGDYSGLRSRDGRFPQRPVDWELARRLAKRFGPVQQYDDET